jgi:hypothetical protein
LVSAYPTIHRVPTQHQGALVNAYLVETESGVVAVDGLLTISAAKFELAQDGAYGEAGRWMDITLPRRLA